MRRETLESASFAVLALSAMVATTAFVMRSGRQQHRPAAPLIMRVDNWRAYAVGHRSGPADAPVTIIEFSDFQCHFCRQFSLTLQKIRAAYPTKVTVIFRHYPLEAIHPYARAAAIAAECAAEQGRFTEYHDLLFALQDSIGQIAWDALARRAGVTSTDTFSSCLTSRRGNERVGNDVADGDKLGVQGTPTVLVNDRLMPGTPTAAMLDGLVKARLAGQIQMR
jgi:protein-disulfide isomerase